MEKIATYLEWKASYTTRASVNYGIWLGKYKLITGKGIDDTTVHDVLKFRKWLDEHYQPKSIEFAMIVLSNFFKFYRMQGVKCLDPYLIKVPKTKANSYQAVSSEEYVSMLSFIKPTTFVEFEKLIVLRLLWETGIRVSELCSINLSMFDPEKMNMVISTKKSRNVRQIFWSVETHIFLKEFMRLRREVDEKPPMLIGLKNGRPPSRITPRTVQRWIQELAKKAKIEKKISPHSFRHGKAHKILDQGGNPKDVQAILGHSNPASSFTYLQWNDKEFERRAMMFV